MTPQEYDYLRALLKERSGLVFSADKHYLVESRLLPLARKAGLPTLGELVLRLKGAGGEVLKVEEGSLYPALQRLQIQGLIDSEWGHSANNRRARYYRLTPAGRKALASRKQEWRQFARGVEGVLGLERGVSAT